MLGGPWGYRHCRLQHCHRRAARELSLGYRTLARTPGGNVLRLHGDQSGVRRYVIVHLEDC